MNDVECVRLFLVLQLDWVAVAVDVGHFLMGRVA